MTPEPGRIIAAKYRLVAPLAAGGMGSVWTARHVTLDTEIAVKLMAVTLTQSPVAKARFEREAKAAARLKSPHVVQVHDFGVDDDTPYIAMELCTGEDLDALLHRSGRLHPSRAASIFGQACKGARAAHDAGIVHRDIKPSNIFLATMAGDEVVKILDFGVARENDMASGVDRTASGMLLGTPHFMSPEQAQGLPVGPATDLWSLAVVLYLSLTGKLPFPGASMGEILAGVLRDDPPPPTKALPGLPASFDGFFARAMARDPAKRFESATAMAEAFAALVTSADVSLLPGSGPRSDEPLPDTLIADAVTRDASLPRPGNVALAETQAASSDQLAPSDRQASSGQQAPSSRQPISNSDPSSAALSSSSEKAPSVSDPSSAALSSSGEKAPSVSDQEVKKGAGEAGKRGKWWMRIGATFAVALAVAAYSKLGPKGDSASPSSTATSSATAPAANRPVAITDLPPPEAANPAVLPLYSAALQAIRDANWGRATERIREAVALDPGFSAGQLRLALLTSETDAPGARAALGRATEGRSRLSERDRMFLAAVEPTLRDPPDVAETARRAKEAYQRYPMDAEIVLFAALSEENDDEQMNLTRRATELDPSYADAWQTLARLHQKHGQDNEAAEALDHCVAISPTSVDCLNERFAVERQLGRCDAASKDIRRVLAIAPNEAWLYQSQIEMLQWSGVAPEALLDVYRKKWSVAPEAKRRVMELTDTADVQYYAGDFEAARRALTELASMDAQVSASTLALQSSLTLAIAAETGDAKEALREVEIYAKRLEGRPQEQSHLIHLWRALARGGVLSKEEYRKRRDAWLKAHAIQGTTDPQVWWGALFAADVQSKEEAQEALSFRPPGPPSRVPVWNDANTARLLVLGGQPEDALFLLRRVNTVCSGHFSSPLIQHAHGLALEMTGDKPSACAAYSKVLERWGHAKPRSRTAESARARMTALRCPL